MNEFPLVTCIIPSYNNLEYLPRAVKSIERQSYSNIQLIIADDCSVGFNEHEIALTIEKKRFSSVLVFSNECNVGTVRNINKALLSAEGEYVMILACDDLFYDEHVVDKVVNRFEDTNCNVLVCRRIKFDCDCCEIVDFLPNRAQARYAALHKDPRQVFERMGTARIYDFASGSCMYYRLDFMQSMGLYDERYDLWEDGPFLARLSREGEEIELGYDIDAIYYQDGGASSNQNGESKTAKRLLDDYYVYLDSEFINHSKELSLLTKHIVMFRRYSRGGMKIKIHALLRFPLGFIFLKLNNWYGVILGKMGKPSANELRVALSEKEMWLNRLAAK